jgi:hypothetical protein
MAKSHARKRAAAGRGPARTAPPRGRRLLPLAAFLNRVAAGRERHRGWRLVDL